MNFQTAYNYMKHGHKIKLPEWGGYWYWKDNTIFIHTRGGKDMDIRETMNVDYTIGFTFINNWEFAD